MTLFTPERHISARLCGSPEKALDSVSGEAFSRRGSLLLTPRHQWDQLFTVSARTPRPETLTALLPHSPRLRWARGASPLICAVPSVWTLVSGLSLAKLYNSPSFGLNVPPYKHLLEKTGINEVTAQYKATFYIHEPIYEACLPILLAAF